mmetsp:Transcript_1514/g.5176  ORF Transcript_1514/g.5176 Transcript_1514/m.5176 type:complete len:213 (+) Transcript_1514:1601-2239(+)
MQISILTFGVSSMKIRFEQLLWIFNSGNGSGEVIDCLLFLVQIVISETTLLIDQAVFRIQLNGSLKITQGMLQFTHRSVTNASLHVIHWIFIIVNCHRVIQQSSIIITQSLKAIAPVEMILWLGVNRNGNGKVFDCLRMLFGVVQFETREEFLFGRALMCFFKSVMGTSETHRVCFREDGGFLSVTGKIKAMNYENAGKNKKKVMLYRCGGE